MNCSSCEGGIIVGRLSIPVEAPLNRKGGGLALAGVGVTQAGIKAAWEGIPNEERTIVCGTCGAEHDYLPGKGIVPKGEGAIGIEAGGEEEVSEEVEATEEEAAPVAAPAKRPLLKAAPPMVKAPAKPLAKPAPAPVKTGGLVKSAPPKTVLPVRGTPAARPIMAPPAAKPKFLLPKK